MNTRTRHSFELDTYVVDTLMRDLVAHDHKPSSFLVYLWLLAEAGKKEGPVAISYADLAENVGLSKSAAQSSVAWLKQRELISSTSDSVTATPVYTLHFPWRRRRRNT
jgi:predicted transcriptional regulator